MPLPSWIGVGIAAVALAGAAFSSVFTFVSKDDVSDMRLTVVEGQYQDLNSRVRLIDGEVRAINVGIAELNVMVDRMWETFEQGGVNNDLVEWQCAVPGCPLKLTARGEQFLTDELRQRIDAKLSDPELAAHPAAAFLAMEGLSDQLAALEGEPDCDPGCRFAVVGAYIGFRPGQ